MLNMWQPFWTPRWVTRDEVEEKIGYNMATDEYSEKEYPNGVHVVTYHLSKWCRYGTKNPSFITNEGSDNPYRLDVSWHETGTHDDYDTRMYEGIDSKGDFIPSRRSGTDTKLDDLLAPKWERQVPGVKQGVTRDVLEELRQDRQRAIDAVKKQEVKKSWW